MEFEDVTYKWGKMQGKTLVHFIESLEFNDIRYFVLRNHEGLPFSNPSKDIDIVIDPERAEEATSIFITSLKSNGFTHYHVVKHGTVYCFFGMNYENNTSIEVDLLGGCFISGYELFPFGLLYQNVTNKNAICTLSSHYEIVLLLLYKVFRWKKIKDSYKQEINKVVNTAPQSLKNVLKYSFGKTMADTIFYFLFNEEYQKLLELAPKAIYQSNKRSFLRSSGTIRKKIAFITDKCYRIIWCPRKYQNFIAVEGPDGTGKSTFIEGLCKKLAFYYVTDEDKFHVYHFRPTILPNLGEVGEKSKIKEQDKDFTNPHRAKPANIISSYIRMLYYWFDYFVGVPFLLRKDVKSDKFTIYDRYIYDFLIDPKRSRINLPYSVRKLFVDTVLQPRLVFVLLTDARLIHKRKQELTAEEITRQLNEFSKLAENNKRFIVIDTGRPHEENVNLAVKTVIDEFTTKIV